MLETILIAVIVSVLKAELHVWSWLSLFYHEAVQNTKETALSSMKAKLIAMAHNSCTLFPIMDGVSIIGKTTSLPVVNTNIQVSIHKYNAGF